MVIFRCEVLVLSVRIFSVSAGFGYTGLQNAKTTAVYGIPVSTSASTIYAFAPGYVAVLARASAPSLVAGQSFDAEFNSFFNCNTVADTDHLSRSYITLGARGPVIPLLYYNASFCFGFALGSHPKAGIMGKGGITYYPDFLSSALTFTTVKPYSSMEMRHRSRFLSSLIRSWKTYRRLPTARHRRPQRSITSQTLR